MKSASSFEFIDSRLPETVADIAYLAGHRGYYSGNSRQDMANFIWWAREFVQLHASTCWEDTDYTQVKELCEKS